MSIPNTEEVRILNDYIRNPLSLRLFSNNISVGETTSLASFVEVSGGGYVAISLATGTWVVAAGNPSSATYAQQIFTFTGATAGPGTIYGYYLVDTVTGLYVGGENLPGAVSPLTPVSGSKIRITPLVQAS